MLPVVAGVKRKMFDEDSPKPKAETNGSDSKRLKTDGTTCLEYAPKRGVVVLVFCCSLCLSARSLWGVLLYRWYEDVFWENR